MFSTDSFAVGSGIRISWEMGAEGLGCAEDDLYDGFASFLCLDLTTGTAIDVNIGGAKLTKGSGVLLATVRPSGATASLTSRETRGRVGVRGVPVVSGE